jgi:metallo-beta-lactamase class B
MMLIAFREWAAPHTINTLPPEWRSAMILPVLLTIGAALGATPSACHDCVAWNESQKPFQVYGDTYYVGVHGLASILITSSQGHVLIDGDLPESAPKIAANIRALGFKVEDVKLILNSQLT